ncbi:MAG TPA: molecular chaperone HtpG, partial [Saprospiraceae bacterium]|nr:molecular chaperone HtpG [Saprospiraceae bacterium]
GVIDSPDIPLNVSRSYLQSDSNVRKITGYITKKIADKLQELFKQDRKNFESKWNEVGVFVKYGMLSDEKFYEKAQKFVLLKNTENEFFTIEEYKKKVEENQKDKSDKIIFLYTNNALEHDGFVQNARSAGYDVLIFDQITDNHFIHNLEFKQSEIAFRRVDSDTLDNLVKKEEVKTSVLSEKEQATLKEAFEKVLSGEKKNIELKPLSPEDAPVQIVKPEFLRRMKEMQTLSGMDWSDFPETINVVVNSNHPVVVQKIMESEESVQNELIRYLYDLALLQQNMLKGADLTAFTKKALTFLK